MIRILIFIVFSLLLYSPCGYSESAKSLLVATGDFVPYTSSTLPEGGFVDEIVMRAFELGGMEASAIYLPWARGYMGTQKRHFDATFPYIKTRQREAIFLYSNSVFPMAISVYIHRDNVNAFVQPEDFVGHTLCLPRAYATHRIEPFLRKGLMNLVRASSDEACMSMVQRKRVSAFPVDVLIGRELLTQLPELFKDMTPLTWAVDKGDYYLIVSKDHPHGQSIIEHFNRGLAKLKASPEWDRILLDHGIDERHLQNLQQTPNVSVESLN